MNRPPTMLIACGRSKDPDPQPARDLYTGDLFRKARAYAEACGARWFILSAKHGLLDPAAVVAPYDLCLADLPTCRQLAWGGRVRLQLVEHGVTERPLILIAGKLYREALGLPPAETVALLEGLGIGQQRAWLARETAQLTRAAA